MSTVWKEQTMGNSATTRNRSYRNQRSFYNTKPILDKNSTDTQSSTSTNGDSKDHIALHDFPPQVDKIYSSNNLMTIRVESKLVTRSIGEWIAKDPLSFAQVRNKYDFDLEPHLNRVLFERMRRIPNKQKQFLGLKLNIDFPKYSEPIPASIPYKRYPVEFYMWWLENKDAVKLSFKEKLELLNKVNMLNKDALLPQHLALMNRI